MLFWTIRNAMYKTPRVVHVYLSELIWLYKKKTQHNTHVESCSFIHYKEIKIMIQINNDHISS